MNEVEYRGYRIVTDDRSGYVEIWYGSDAVGRADTVTQAEWTIDDWLWAP